MVAARGDPTLRYLAGRVRELRRAALAIRIRDVELGRAGRLAAADDPRLVRLGDPSRTIALLGASAAKTAILRLLLNDELLQVNASCACEVLAGSEDAHWALATIGSEWLRLSKAAPPASLPEDGVAAPVRLRRTLRRWPLHPLLNLIDLPHCDPPTAALPRAPWPRPDLVLFVFQTNWNAAENSGKDPFHDEVVLDPLRELLEEFGPSAVVVVPNRGAPRNPADAVLYWRGLQATADALRRETARTAASWGFPGLATVPVAAGAAAAPGDGDRFGVGPLRATLASWVEASAGAPTAARLRDAADAVGDLGDALARAEQLRLGWAAERSSESTLSVIAPVATSQDLPKLVQQARILSLELASAGSARR